MANRRRIIQYGLTLAAATLSSFIMIKTGLRTVWAESKRRIIEKNTPLSKLMHANPAKIDTSRLETTPIEQFDVMGETDLEIRLENWHLLVDGDVINPSEFTYDDLLNRPILERNALLICPGFFAYNAFWRGFSVADMLREASLKKGATHVLFYGSKGFRKKKKRYTIDEVLADKIFAAYQVNGQDLPMRHGFPLRLVADDHRGGRWVKYLNRISVESR